MKAFISSVHHYMACLSVVPWIAFIVKQHNGPFLDFGLYITRFTLLYMWRDLLPGLSIIYESGPARSVMTPGIQLEPGLTITS